MFWSCRWLCHLEAVPVRCTPHLGARLVGHVVGSCTTVAPAYASDTSGLDFVEEFAGKKDFFVALPISGGDCSCSGSIGSSKALGGSTQRLSWIKQSAPRTRHSKLLQKAKSNKRWQRPWSLLNPAGRKRSSKGQ